MCVTAIKEAEAVALKPEHMKAIQDGRNLVAVGDMLRIEADYVAAVISYLKAVRRVMKIKLAV